MAGRRFLLYFAWSRPGECDVELGSLENRYPTLFEFRRALWPILDQLRSMPDQLVGGFLDHVILSDFELFRKLIREETGNEVQVLQRVLDSKTAAQLEKKMIDEFDTIIIVSLDHFRTSQAPTNVEVEFLNDFLSRPGKCVVICPHHDIGGSDVQKQTEIEYRHHGDGLLPPQQQIGGFARSLLANIGYPVENRFGLNPAKDENGQPSELIINRDFDDTSILQGVTSFNLHPHLPHLFVPTNIADKVSILARQAINLGATNHPFVDEGNRYFNAMLQIGSEQLGGSLYVCDATLWSSAFGGQESLKNFWNNLSRAKL